MTDQPFTKIQPDSTWSSPTHLGFEYAALLVDPGYVPAPTMDSLPTQGGLVAAVATVKGGNAPPVISKSLQFSGYEWTVRNAISSRNGSPNKYETANAWTDPKGLLHLRIAREADQWTCSEVLLTSSFGYGTYLFFVRDVSHLQPAAALSIFTWDDLGVEQNHREMDIEISRWGDPENKNAQFVIQPFYVAENVSRFTVPAGPLTFSLRWAPGKATFESFRGYTMASKARPLAEHVFTSGVPTPGGESVHLNFCAFKFSKVPLQHEAEVVIEKVQYLP